MADIESRNGERLALAFRRADPDGVFLLLKVLGHIQRPELRAEAGSSLWQIIEERRVHATTDEALAQLYQALTATVGSNFARLLTEETVCANADSALSSTIASISADVNGWFARGLVKLDAAADQSGVNARFSVMSLCPLDHPTGLTSA